MGEIVAAFATSHAPGITAFPERAEPRQVEAVHGALRKLQADLRAAHPDVLVCVSVEHFTNFFLNNLPTFCIGIADTYVGPPDRQFVEFLKTDQRTFAGHATLGRALLEEALRSGFDPASTAGDFAFDENFSVPLHFLLPEADVPVVPIIVNGVQPPYPTLRRCYEFGAMLRRALERQRLVPRVALLATGGLSHWVGTPEAGQINTDFDHRLLDLLGSGRADEITAWSDDEVEAAGNGAHEIRSWLIVSGAVPAHAFEVLAYEPVPAWLTGTAVATLAV